MSILVLNDSHVYKNNVNDADSKQYLKVATQFGEVTLEFLNLESYSAEKDLHPKGDGTMNIVLLGAPGAGKGTQGEVISDYFSIPTISTGNIIREALKSGTELGLKAKSYISSGELVPDEVVIAIIKERLCEDDCKNGFILDGFPRTIEQAEALDEMGIIIDKVVDFDVSDDVIVSRMSGRRVCSECGASYHIANKKPKEAGVCDRCKGTLVQREDDHAETVKKRLAVYHKKTKPLEDYYRKQGKLAVIDGSKTVEETKKLTIEALEA